MNPHKSNHATNSQLKTPHSIVHNVLHKLSHLRAYKIQLLQVLKLNDQVGCTNFTVDMLERHDFLNKLCFSDEVNFHVSRVVNGYKSPCHMSTGDKKCQNEYVVLLNA